MRRDPESLNMSLGPRPRRGVGLPGCRKILIIQFLKSKTLPIIFLERLKKLFKNKFKKSFFHISKLQIEQNFDVLTKNYVELFSFYAMKLYDEQVLSIFIKLHDKFFPLNKK